MDVISTTEVPAGERFTFWRDVNSQLWAPYELRCEPALRNGFRARVGISHFGPVQATLLTTMPHSVHRTPKLIRQADPEMLKLGCLVQGNGMVTHDHRNAHVGVGDLILYDTSRSYQAAFAPDVPLNRLMLLRFPRASLPLSERDLRRLTGVRIPGDRGVGALSSQFLLQLARHMGELGPAGTARLTTLTLDVLAAALADALDTHGTIPPHTRQRALTAQIHAFIRANLGDPHLTPDAIAAAHHISRRYLHKLFHAEGHTVAGWIRTRRLDQCRRDLADPLHAAVPIGAVAARWGFPNAAHFSRTFREAYGLSPRQFRDQQAAPAARFT